MTQKPLIDPAIEAIARDPELSDALKQQLIGVAHDTAKLDATRGDAKDQFQAQHRRGRWNTPLWVALTGLITLGGNFAFDYWRTEQSAEISTDQTRLTAENDRLIARQNAEASRQAQALSFQYDVIKSELANLKTAEDRANSLRLLVRIGVLGEPLQLSEIDAILREVKEGQTESLPPVGGGATAADGHQYKPCRDMTLPMRITPGMVNSLRESLNMTTPLARGYEAHLDALTWAMANNGICGPEQVALVFGIAMLETNNLQTFEMSEAEAIRLHKRFPKFLGNASEEEAALYRGRGLSMLTGKRNYATYANDLNRPELLITPDIARNDPQLSAEIFINYLKRAKVLDNCTNGRCDVPAAVKRINTGTAALEQVYLVFDVALLAMLE